jgi:DNA-binding transcriptional LysR family regulator
MEGLMKIQQLRYVVAVADAGSVTEAARRLNVSQPALSAGLSALEADLGGAIFDRRRGAMRLTQLGVRFHRRAVSILRECDVARMEFRRGLERSTIAVGVLPTIAMPLVLDFTRRFAIAEPRMEMTLREGAERTLMDWLAHGRIDAALTISDQVGADAWIPLEGDPRALVCSCDHPFARRGSVRLADLDGVNFILRAHCERGREAHEILEIRGVRLRLVLRTDQDQRALAAVRAGLGVTIAPRSLVGRDTAFVPIEDLGLARTVGLHLGPSIDPELAAMLTGILKAANGDFADAGEVTPLRHHN